MKLSLSLDHILAAQGADGTGFKEKEPSANRTVSILETYRDETDFLAGHFSTGRNGEICAGAGVERRIPGAAKAFTG